VSPPRGTGAPCRIAAALLAAGSSRRLGQPKQLVELDGRPLVRRAAEAALAAGCEPVFAVLGAHAGEVAAALAELPVLPLRNEAHEEGLASSIRVAAAAAERATPACDGLLLFLVDQPRVGAALLARLAARFAEGGGERIAACTYAGTVGAPAIFPRARFPALAALRGPRGAKPLLEAERGRVLEVTFPEGGVDVDTAEDLAALRGRGVPPDGAASPMTGRRVLEILAALRSHGVNASVDGGWGVDALVGRETRAHEDLDLVVALGDVDAIRSALRAFGYSIAEDHLPVRFVMRDATGSQLDLHTVSFDAQGGGVQPQPGGGSFRYPPEGFVRGRIAGESVSCISAEVQLLCHLGYEPTAKDVHDVLLLCTHLDLAVPSAYRELPAPGRGVRRAGE
jgi:CTP:molybdopterin cytidylyltransferase MocA